MEKKNELNERELKQVSGGFDEYEVTEIHYNVLDGDTFRRGEYYYVIRGTKENIPATTMIDYDYYWYNRMAGTYGIVYSSGMQLRWLLENTEYIGNGIVNAK